MVNYLAKLLKLYELLPLQKEKYEILSKANIQKNILLLHFHTKHFDVATCGEGAVF